MLRCVIFCLLTILVINSLIFVAVASFLHLATNEICPFLQHYHVTEVIIGLSVIFLMLQILQYFAVCLKIKFLSFIYSAIVIIVILAGIPIIVLSALNMNIITEKINQCYKVKLDQVKLSNIMNYINKFQKNGKCCGLFGPEDWLPNVPDSCCIESDFCPPFYQDGCLDELADEFSAIMTGFLVLISIEITGSIIVLVGSCLL